MNSNRTLSLQDIRKRRQEEVFVGRDTQIAQFRRNWALPLEDHRRSFIYNISGQGGVGKSYLLGRFRQYAEADGAITAWVDEAEKDVIAVMERIASQLEQQGHALKAFNERCKVYRQRRQEIEADP